MAADRGRRLCERLDAFPAIDFEFSLTPGKLSASLIAGAILGGGELEFAERIAGAVHSDLQEFCA
jgi:hypothetical protein